MQDVAVFWDYENCPVPSNSSGYSIVNNICTLALAYGSIKSLKAYLEIEDQAVVPRASALRSELQSSGVSLVDCPHNGRKDVADKMIIVDMLVHAIDNPAPSTVMIITGDRDFAYAMSILRLRHYRVVLVTLNNAHPSLTSQASLCFDWNTEVLERSALPPKAARSNPSMSEKPVSDKSSESSLTSESSRSTVTESTFGKSKAGALRNPPSLSMIQNSSQEDEAFDFPGSSISREDIEILIHNIRQLPSFNAFPKKDPISQSKTQPVQKSEVPLVAGTTMISSTQTTQSYMTSSESCQSDTGVDLSPPEYPPSAPNNSLVSSSFKVSASPFSKPPIATPTILPTSLPVQSPLIASGEASSNASTISPNSNQPPSNPDPRIPSPKSPGITTPIPLPGLPSFSSMVKNGITGNTFSPVNVNPSSGSVEIPFLAEEFRILVQVLLKYKSQGTLRPLRSTLANEVSQNGLTFKKANVEKFRDYIRLAQQRGIIEMGGEERAAWIALKPKYYSV